MRLLPPRPPKAAIVPKFKVKGGGAAGKPGSAQLELLPRAVKLTAAAQGGAGGRLAAAEDEEERRVFYAEFAAKAASSVSAVARKRSRLQRRGRDGGDGGDDGGVADCGGSVGDLRKRLDEALEEVFKWQAQQEEEVGKASRAQEKAQARTWKPLSARPLRRVSSSRFQQQDHHLRPHGPGR